MVGKETDRTGTESDRPYRARHLLSHGEQPGLAHMTQAHRRKNSDQHTLLTEVVLGPPRWKARERSCKSRTEPGIRRFNRRSYKVLLHIQKRSRRLAYASNATTGYDLEGICRGKTPSAPNQMSQISNPLADHQPVSVSTLRPDPSMPRPSACSL